MGWMGRGAQWQLIALICLSIFLTVFSLSLFRFLSLVSLFPFSIPGFPLDKAVAYSKLRNPFLINDLAMQYYIQDRYSFLMTGGMGGSEIMTALGGVESNKHA